MTVKELEQRIKDLQPQSLELLCKTPAGENKLMTVQECKETGSEFIRVVSGNDLGELDALLAYMLGHSI